MDRNIFKIMFYGVPRKIKYKTCQTPPPPKWKWMNTTYMEWSVLLWVTMELVSILRNHVIEFMRDEMRETSYCSLLFHWGKLFLCGWVVMILISSQHITQHIIIALLLLSGSLCWLDDTERSQLTKSSLHWSERQRETLRMNKPTDTPLWSWQWKL